MKPIFYRNSIQPAAVHFPGQQSATLSGTELHSVSHRLAEAENDAIWQG